MSRGFLVGALLAVACGGSDQGAVFGQDFFLPSGGTQAIAGSVGDAGGAQVVGGSTQTAAGQPGAGVAPIAGTTTGGSAGAQSGGSGGVVVGAGGASQAGNGGAAAGSHTGGAAGAGGKEPTGGSKADGGAGGETDPPIVCPKGGLNCDGVSSNGCETSAFAHDHCGDCDTACDSTQKCVAGKATGAPVCLTL